MKAKEYSLKEDLKTEFSDFKVDFSISVKEDDKRYYSALSLKNTETLDLTGITDYYHVGGKDLFFSTDGYLYYKDGKRVCDAKFSCPTVTEILVRGEKQLAVISDGFSFITGENSGYFKFIKGDAYALYNGLMFIAKQNKIYFSRPFNNLSLSENPEIDGEITLEEEYGKVIAMEGTAGGLKVFCERKIAVIKPFGSLSEYTLIACDFTVKKIMEGSVKKTGEYIYYLDDGKLYRYKNGTEKVKSILGDKEYSVTGYAKEYKGNYLLPVSISGKKYIYLYGDGEYFIKAKDVILSEDGNAYNVRTNKLLKVDVSSGCYLISFEKVKVGGFITGFIGEFSSSVSIKLKGDFGERSYTGKGTTVIPFCLKTDYVSVEISSPNPFTAKRIKISV